MKKIIIVLIVISTAFTSSKAQESSTINKTNKEIEFTYPKTIIPQDTTKLWIAEGDATKQIVTIFLQGGPKDDLDFETRGKSSWRYLPDYKEYYSIHLHQANTWNTDIFRYDGEFTMDMARVEVDNTSEMLYRAIKHFKDKGKTVWVMGHSYGAFIIPHYLATRPSLADKYVIISGRLEDPKDEVDAHKKGFNGSFKYGVDFISEEGRDFSDYNQAAIKYYIGKQRIKAAIGEISYIQALKDVDLSNVIYIYSPQDERVGGLTQKEQKFLLKKDAKLFSSNWSHGKTIYELVDLVKAEKLKL